MKIKTLLLCMIVVFILSCNENSQRRRQNDNLNDRNELITIEKQKKESLQFKEGEEYSIKVVGVTDGDTFTGLTAGNQQLKCRIYGIDAPEKKQAFGDRSKQALSDLIFGEQVLIKIQNKDHYGRAVVLVFTTENKDISTEMLKMGMAWHFKRYDNSQEYAKLESFARIQGVGLWNDKNPVAPWLYRKK